MSTRPGARHLPAGSAGRLRSRPTDIRPAPVRRDPARVRDGSGRRHAGPAGPGDRRARCRPSPRSADRRRDPQRADAAESTRRRVVSLRLEAAAEIAAPVDRVWDELVDWPGQAPLDPVHHGPDHVGARRRAGRTRGRAVRLLARPACRSDCSTASWSPAGLRPTGSASRAELEVLHLGPYFTGEGVFAAGGPRAAATRVTLHRDRSTCPLAPADRAPGPAAAAGAARWVSTSACAGWRRVCEAARDRACNPVPTAGCAAPGRCRPRSTSTTTTRVGPAGHQRRRALRAADPGGLPVGPVLDHHPAQAGGVPDGVRRLRPGAGRPRSTRPMSSG